LSPFSTLPIILLNSSGSKTPKHIHGSYSLKLNDTK
jgi:hypothetical protein